MTHLLRVTRALLVFALELALLGTYVAGPWVDREPVARVSIEARHEDGQCPSAHDHGICVQLQQARNVPQRATPAFRVATIAAPQTATPTATFVTRSFALSSQPRAPPVLHS